MKSVMPQSVDWAIIARESLTAIAEQYAHEVGSKLEAMYQVTVENVTRSAARHAQRHDRNAVIPDYAVGDKVMLRDPTTKKGESPKLKRRYTGPFLVVECKSGFNCRLQHFDTGRTLKRLVHANRL
jgi:hypothetical protein